MNKIKNNGFTIVELVIAMTIFSIAMLYGLSFFVYANMNHASSGESSYGLQLAKDVLENAKSNGYISIPVGNVVVSHTSPSGLVYGIKRTVTEIKNSTGIYKEITAEITWTDSHSIARQATLKTILAN